MSRSFHFCLDVKGFLMHSKLRDYKGMFTRDDGSSMSPEEAKRTLLDELAKGHEKLPMGKCDNFDFKEGCLGHEEVGDVNA